MIIHTTNGTHAFRLPFYSVTDHLDDSRFLQCNRGIMLNMDYIKTMESDYFEMTDSKCFPIKTKGRKQIREQYIKYQFLKLEEAWSFMTFYDIFTYLCTFTIIIPLAVFCLFPVIDHLKTPIRHLLIKISLVFVCYFVLLIIPYMIFQQDLGNILVFLSLIHISEPTRPY